MGEKNVEGGQCVGKGKVWLGRGGGRSVLSTACRLWRNG